LLVAEGEVGGNIRRLLEQQPGVDRRAEHGGEIRFSIAEPISNGIQISKAEAPTEDRRVAEHDAGVVWKSRRAPPDQRSDGRWDESSRVPAEPPLAADLLERAGLAVRPRQLLDDERHALRLDVHRLGGRAVDRPAEDRLEQL